MRSAYFAAVTPALQLFCRTSGKRVGARPKDKRAPGLARRPQSGIDPPTEREVVGG